MLRPAFVNAAGSGGLFSGSFSLLPRTPSLSCTSPSEGGFRRSFSSVSLKRVIIPMKMADSAATNTPVSHTLIDAVPVLHPTSSLSQLKRLQKLEEEVDPGEIPGTSLRILKYPHPKLRAQNEEVTVFDDELRKVFFPENQALPFAILAVCGLLSLFVH